MTQIPDHPVYSKNVLEMLTVAHDYCQTLKKVETIEKQKLLEYLTRVGPLLYLKGTLLPEIEVRNPDKNERFYTEEEWEILFNTLRKIFGKEDTFWHSDPDAADEVIKVSLAEYLTDIYQDLQDFLTLYQKNSLDSKENAVSELHRLFIENWGTKILMGLSHLHQLLFRSALPTAEFNRPQLF